MEACVRACVCAPQSECSSNSCQRKSGQLAASSVRHCWNTYCSSHLSETTCCSPRECGVALTDPHHRNPHLFLPCFLGCKIYWSRTITLTTLLTFFLQEFALLTCLVFIHFIPGGVQGGDHGGISRSTDAQTSVTSNTSSTSSRRIPRSCSGSPSSGSCLEQVNREASRWHVGQVRKPPLLRALPK